nr:MAG TPA: hypothetical protein [Caudoviricetes sp.]
MFGFEVCTQLLLHTYIIANSLSKSPPRKEYRLYTYPMGKLYLLIT